MGDAAFCKRHPASAIADNNGVLGSGDLFIVERNALHQFHRIDALLKAHAAQIVEDEPGERDNRSTVERCLVQAVHQMDRARAGRSDTNAKASGVLGEACSHERRGFLVADSNVANAILTFAQSFNDRINAIADNAEQCVAPQAIKVSTNMSDVFKVIARQRRWLGRERFVCFRRCSREVFDRGDRREAGDRCSLENIPPQKPVFLISLI